MKRASTENRTLRFGGFPEKSLHLQKMKLYADSDFRLSFCSDR